MNEEPHVTILGIILSVKEQLSYLLGILISFTETLDL